MKDEAKQKLAALVGIALVIGSRAAWHLSRPLLAPLDPADRLLVNLGFAWAITGLLLLHIRIWERRDWQSIGIRRMSRQDAVWAFVAFLVGGAIISGTIPLIHWLGLQSTEAGVRRLAEFSLFLRVLMILTAAVTEEIRYRGYLIERLNQLTGRIGLSAAISWLVFFLVHLPGWSLGGAVQIGLGSVVLYALYVWRRNLLACMTMHLLNNTVAFLVVPAFLPR